MSHSHNSGTQHQRQILREEHKGKMGQNRAARRDPGSRSAITQQLEEMLELDWMAEPLLPSYWDEITSYQGECDADLGVDWQLCSNCFTEWLDVPRGECPNCA